MYSKCVFISDLAEDMHTCVLMIPWDIYDYS